MILQCLAKAYEQAVCCIIDTQWCTRAAMSDALYLNKKQFDKILLIVAMGKQQGIDALRLHAIHNLLKPFSGMIGQKEIRHGIESVEDIIFQKNILLDQCYPFAEKDGHNAKKTSSKALVMSYAYSNVLLDKIEEAAKHGLVGNENDNW